MIPFIQDIPDSNTDKDIPPPLPENTVDLDTAQKEVENQGASIEAIVSEANFLSAYMDYGHDLGLNAIGLKQGYLTNTAMAMYGLEALNDESVTFATEAVTGAIAGKLASWSAKALSTLKATGEAILGFITRRWTNLKNLALRVKDGGKKVIKSYPFTIALTAVTACLGLGAAAPALLRTVPGILSGVGRATSAAVAAERTVTASTEAAKAAGIMNRIISGLKWPFAKLSVAVKGRSIKLVTEDLPVKEVSGEASSMGWTRQAISGLMGRLSGVTQFAPKLSAMAKDTVSKDIADVTAHFKSGHAVKGVGVGLLKAGLVYLPFLSAAWGVVTAVFKLIKTIIWGTFTLLTSTFSKLTGHGSEPAPQPETPANA